MTEGPRRSGADAAGTDWPSGWALYPAGSPTGLAFTTDLGFEAAVRAISSDGGGVCAAVGEAVARARRGVEALTLAEAPRWGALLVKEETTPPLGR